MSKKEQKKKKKRTSLNRKGARGKEKSGEGREEKTF